MQREKDARSEAERQRQLAEQARRARAEHDRLIRELLKHGSPAVMQRWMREGLITGEEVRERLQFAEWPTADIDRWIDEAENGDE